MRDIILHLLLKVKKRLGYDKNKIISDVVKEFGLKIFA